MDVLTETDQYVHMTKKNRTKLKITHDQGHIRLGYTSFY